MQRCWIEKDDLLRDLSLYLKPTLVAIEVWAHGRAEGGFLAAELHLILPPQVVHLTLLPRLKSLRPHPIIVYLIYIYIFISCPINRYFLTVQVNSLPPKVKCKIGGAVRNLPGAVRKFLRAKKVTSTGKKNPLQAPAWATVLRILLDY